MKDGAVLNYCSSDVYLKEPGQSQWRLLELPDTVDTIGNASIAPDDSIWVTAWTRSNDKLLMVTRDRGVSWETKSAEGIRLLITRDNRPIIYGSGCLASNCEERAERARIWISSDGVNWEKYDDGPPATSTTDDVVLGADERLYVLAHKPQTTSFEIYRSIPLSLW